jgi:hypothetical protein
MHVKAQNEFLENGIRPEVEDQMKCDWCGREFSPAKPWQHFCNPKCRDDWHNRERKRAAFQTAEDRREDRMNGHANGAGEKIDLAALGLVTKAVAPIRRRRIGAA